MGQNFVAHKTENVMVKQVLRIQLPTGSGMIDTVCRCACGGHDIHASVLATMDSVSWPYRKVKLVAFYKFWTWTTDSI